MTIANIPAQPTPFIGREEALRHILEILTSPDCQLITLVGVGGVGKTRLAIEVALAVESNYPDGIAFVPLQPVQSADFLPAAIIDALDLPLHGQEQAADKLIGYLSSREVLLILDNFEHLLDGGDLLNSILTAAPHTKILATSREVLNLRQEWVWVIEGMRIPESTDVEYFETYDSIQLFVECAQRVQPNFSLAEEYPQIVQILQLVEGIPLAIELAASWLKMMSCAAIAAEIRHNLDFLNTSLRNVPERHRSMRAVFDQSWGMLSLAEQKIFARLSVFRGGFQLEAGEQVAGASLFMLSSLVDKSLLRHDPTRRRYLIHELLRQFAQEKLAQHPEAVMATRDAHRDYFLNFLHTRTDDLLAKRQKQALTEIAPELENIRRAWKYAIQSKNVVAIGKAAYSLATFYDFCGRYIEAIDTLGKAAAILDESSQEEAEALAMILIHLAWAYIRTAQLESAREALEQVEAIYQHFQITPWPGLGTETTTGFGVLSIIAGDYQRALRQLEEARQRTEARGDQHNLMMTRNFFASAYLAVGNYEQAYHYAHLAYTTAKSIGDEWFMAYCLNELGNAASALKDYREAEQHYRESYNIRSAFNDPEGSALALTFLGQVANLQSKHEEALEHFHRSLTTYRELSDRGGLAMVLQGLGSAFRGLELYEQARKHYQEALQIALKSQIITRTLSILCDIGQLFKAINNPDRGLEIMTFTALHPSTDQQTREQVQMLLRGQTLTLILSDNLDVDNIAHEVFTELGALVIQEPATPQIAQAQAIAKGLLDPLSERELEILELLAQGMTNQEIAEALTVVLGTVKAHNHNIFSKLGVRNRVEAITRARELKLI